MVYDFNDSFAHALGYLAHLLPFVFTIQTKPKPGKTQLGAISTPLSKQQKPTGASQIHYTVLIPQPQVSPHPAKQTFCIILVM